MSLRKPTDATEISNVKRSRKNCSLDIEHIISQVSSSPFGGKTCIESMDSFYSSLGRKSKNSRRFVSDRSVGASNLNPKRFVSGRSVGASFPKPDLNSRQLHVSGYSSEIPANAISSSWNNDAIQQLLIQLLDSHSQLLGKIDELQRHVILLESSNGEASEAKGSNGKQEQVRSC